MAITLKDYKTLHEKCPYSAFFWSVFSRIWSEYGERISLYSVRMRENTDQKNSEYGDFSRSEKPIQIFLVLSNFA